MTDLALIVVFIVMLLSGTGIVSKIDSFISHHVVKYNDSDEEEHEHEQSETIDDE